LTRLGPRCTELVHLDKHYVGQNEPMGAGTLVHKVHARNFPGRAQRHFGLTERVGLQMKAITCRNGGYMRGTLKSHVGPIVT
jgi:hypothetical protein